MRFLDEFRRIHAQPVSSRLISLRVPEPLLGAFKTRCKIEVRYQTRIKELMTDWLGRETPGP